MKGTATTQTPFILPLTRLTVRLMTLGLMIVAINYKSTCFSMPKKHQQSMKSLTTSNEFPINQESTTPATFQEKSRHNINNLPPPPPLASIRVPGERVIINGEEKKVWTTTSSVTPSNNASSTTTPNNNNFTNPYIFLPLHHR
jgi:hypothetical protein